MCIVWCDNYWKGDNILNSTITLHTNNKLITIPVIFSPVKLLQIETICSTFVSLLLHNVSQVPQELFDKTRAQTLPN